MSNRYRSLAVNLLKILLPVLLVGWLLSRIDAEQWEALRTQPKNYGLLALALVVASGGVVLSFLRWAILVRCQGIAFSHFDAIRLGAIGFLLSFVSAGSVGGDLFKAFFLAKRTPGKRFEAVASVVVDRAVGLYGLLLVVVLALLFFPPQQATRDFQQIRYASATFAVLGTVVICILVVGGRRIDQLLRRFPTKAWWGKLVHRVADPIRVFHTHPGQLLVAALMSMAVHSLLCVSIYLIARGLYATPPTLAEHLIIVPVAMLAAALPITPAGLGLLEAAMEWLYELIPATPTAASGTMVALTFEIVKIILAGCGILCYFSGRKEVDSALQAAQESEAATA